MNNRFTKKKLTGFILLALGTSSVSNYVIATDTCDQSSLYNLSGYDCTSTTGDAIFTVSGVTIDATGSNNNGIHVKSDSTTLPPSTATLNVTDSNVTVAPLIPYSFGIDVNGFHSNIVLNGTNNVLLNGDNSDTGIVSVAYGGNSVITVAPGSVLNVTNNAGATTTTINERDALESDSGGDGAAAPTVATGNAAIYHHGSGTLSAAGGHAVFIKVNMPSGTGSGDGVAILDGSATLITTGNGHKGINVNNKTSGNSIVQSNATIITNGSGTDNHSPTDGSAGTVGIFAYSSGGNASINASGSISINGTGVGTDRYTTAHGIYAQTQGGADKQAYVDYTSGTIIENSSGSDLADSIVAGILARAENGSSAISKMDAGTIEMSNASYSAGISAQTLLSSGVAEVDFLGGIINSTDSSGITTHANGIVVVQSGSGLATVNSAGEINLQGADSTGIYVSNVQNTSLVISNSKITTNDGSGIVVENQSNDALVEATNMINSNQLSTQTYGINVRTLSAGNASVTYDNGSITMVAPIGGAESVGVMVSDGGSNATDVNGYIGLGGHAVIDASRGVGGLNMSLNGMGQIDIAQGAQVHGGGGIDGYALNLTSTVATAHDIVNNAGVIDAMNDRAIVSHLNGASVLINNTGTITGTVNIEGNTDLVFNNLSSRSLDLRNFSDTNSDGVRDTKAVAISTFGGMNSVFNNESSGVVRLLPVTSEQRTDTSNQFLTNSQSVYDTNRSGIVQGQLLNLGRFENRGLIDLTGSGLAGDTLVISGGSTPGVNGGGVYLSDGGQLKIDTMLNEGGVNAQSDILVLDNVTLGRAPTSIIVHNAGGIPAQTVGDGIEVVNVLGASDAGAFVLGHRLVAGPFEYFLYQGGVTDTGMKNWYLRNQDSHNDPIYRPETGVYLGNQTIATGMFMHTLHDRLGEPQFTDYYHHDDNKVPAVWARIVGNRINNSAGDGALDLSTNTYLVHIGGDIAQWSKGASRLHLGVMGAYGESKTEAKGTYYNASQSVVSSASGKVTGYSIGAYATWYENSHKPEGLYVDSWLQYGWFNNSVNAQDESTQQYHSRLWTASLEAGYALIAYEHEKRQWIFEPQAQIAYNHYSVGNIVDGFGTQIIDSDASGFMTRLGARFYSRSKLNDNGIQPFIETNWWHSSAKNSLNFDGYQFRDDTPNNRFEVKVGFQSEIAKGVQLWGHVGGMWGQHGYQNYQAMVGVKFVW